ncbi:MAG: undecaprenyl/decaprenyl-phosphate alpha-N-acetylglucosaminyl 1-phosphate transferase [Gammaproteobacteria bacterium]|nr:undecaprenyl/decaprenyl-phosphate alpha-N-acetylglucosaminyl 1-phosphate transferase [Gammaproteobacteria bacterium]MCW8959299.1 undecaprenyl/decaprenyl-phosphate alpha-N-acetylglucosaminyl 1-phosphate transferase [Gammaproteobacteria bacterium]MCW8992821.1 undecaprenyl/decaprenyl-phosphate alpha-N-acetylglucosaminyl 1-phosphate transferase [Gammaproteobacteria bacterium]
MDVWALGTMVGGFVVSLLSTLVLIRLAPRLGLVDHPDLRKHHTNPTPLVGGVAMFIALLLAAFLFLPASLLRNELIILSLFIVLLGLLDDRFNLKALPRLGLQALLAAGMYYWAGNQLNELGALNFDGNIVLGPLALPMTIIGTVGIINAVNFSDGLDGLAGGLVAIALGYLLFFSLMAGDAHFLELMLLFGVLLGFWVLNARYFRGKKAAVFMGDAGSMFLGFMLAWYFISMSQGEGRVISPVTALWIFALPLFDTVGIMLRRIVRGRSPFAADREHLHHIFLLAGFSVCRTVTVMLLLAITLGMVGLLGEFFGIPDGVMFWSFIGLFTLYFFVMMHAWKAMKWLRSHQS